MTTTAPPHRRPARVTAPVLPVLVLSVLVLGVLVLGVLAPSGPVAAEDPDPLPPEEGPVTLVRTHPGQRLAALADYLQLMSLPSRDTGARARSTAPMFTLADGCPAPRCSDRAVPVPDDVSVTSNLVRVLLPTGYHARRNQGRRYPVVFLLNGVRNDHDSWTFKTELLEASRTWQAIFVMPAGGKLEQAGMFSDWADGSWDWETYHTQVLVPWVDREYRTLPGARAVGGASMGALGALNYAAHHPGLFRAVLSVSGLPDTSLLATQAYTGPPAERPDLRRVWGDPVLDKATWDAHNPILQVERLRGVELFLTSGTGYRGDPGTDEVLTGDFEKSMWETHRGFLLELTTKDVPYRARVAIGGAHDWIYFDPMVQWAMPKIIRLLRR